VIDMFGIFGDTTPNCPVCGLKMINVLVDFVPAPAKREFARLNKYQPISKSGWYFCPEDEMHIHKAAVETAYKYSQYRR
jgi:hypothetical protein